MKYYYNRPALSTSADPGKRTAQAASFIMMRGSGSPPSRASCAVCGWARQLLLTLAHASAVRGAASPPSSPMPLPVIARTSPWPPAIKSFSVHLSPRTPSAPGAGHEPVGTFLYSSLGTAIGSWLLPHSSQAPPGSQVRGRGARQHGGRGCRAARRKGGRGMVAELTFQDRVPPLPEISPSRRSAPPEARPGLHSELLLQQAVGSTPMRRAPPIM